MKSIFNEKRYLNGDSEALEEFRLLREEHLEEQAEDFEKHHKIIAMYDSFLDELASELEKYNLTNPLEYSIFLNYILDSGYLSNDCTFRHKESNKEITGKLGINVVLGEGCCRNISDFHRDIFNKFELTSIPFYCYQGLGRGINKCANHVINLIEYRDNIYGIDLHNHGFLYRFKKPLVMDSISMFDKGKLDYKPYYGLIVDGDSLENIKKNLKTFEECSKKKTISAIEYDCNIRYFAKELVRRKRNELIKFDQKTKQLKKTIASGLNK